jgi:glutaconyl-CoA/methylmalonyl-CoA decarboxylase subunit gamma
VKQYRVTVDGRAFDVTVEEVGGSPRATALAPVAAPAVAPTPAAPAVTPTPAAPAGPTIASPDLMRSPLPGKLLRIDVKPGARVKRGDVLLVIEAMKMENEVMAPRDATIAEVHVTVGQTVNTGDPLVRLA